MWYVGQKVVCIKDCIDTNWIPIKTGTILTIRGIFMGVNGKGGREEGLYFTEIVNELVPTGIERGYNSVKFKPLEKKKTDISIFTEMLNKTPQEMKENLKVLEKEKEPA